MPQDVVVKPVSSSHMPSGPILFMARASYVRMEHNSELLGKE